MSISASQNNYATPAGSYDSLLAADITPLSYVPFSLFNNVLDGSFSPIDSDVGWWAASLPNPDGTLPTPIVLNVVYTDTLHEIRLAGNADQANYPVDFTITFYLSSVSVFSKTVEGNTEALYTYSVPAIVLFDTCIISITKVSRADQLLCYAMSIIRITFLETLQAKFLRPLCLKYLLRSLCKAG